MRVSQHRYGWLFWKQKAAGPPPTEGAFETHAVIGHPRNRRGAPRTQRRRGRVPASARVLKRRRARARGAHAPRADPWARTASWARGAFQNGIPGFGTSFSSKTNSRKGKSRLRPCHITSHRRQSRKMSRGSGTTRDMRTWVETVNKEDKYVRVTHPSWPCWPVLAVPGIRSQFPKNLLANRPLPFTESRRSPTGTSSTATRWPGWSGRRKPRRSRRWLVRMR